MRQTMGPGALLGSQVSLGQERPGAAAGDAQGITAGTAPGEGQEELCLNRSVR